MRNPKIEKVIARLENAGEINQQIMALGDCKKKICRGRCRSLYKKKNPDSAKHTKSGKCWSE